MRVQLGINTTSETKSSLKLSRYFVDLHTLKQLYYSSIYPYLSYATITWGSACKTSLRRILTKQNKCVQSMFFAYSRDNATPNYNLLAILKYENVYKFKVALFTHKILNGSTNISTIFHRTLTRASEIHTHNTRFASKFNFHRPKANNKYGPLLSLLFHLNFGKLILK